MKKRDDLNEVFQVDNNDYGKMEIEVVRNFLKGTPFQIVLYGRNPDRKGTIERMGGRYYAGYQQRLPLKYATKIAVYIRHKDTGLSIKNYLDPKVIEEKNKRMRDLEDKNYLFKIGIRELSELANQ